MAEKIVMASGKGGVGKSTLTVGLCRALSSLGKKALAVDCDVALGCLDIVLSAGAETVFNWGDVVLGNCEMQRALLECDGVSLLTAPREYCEEFTDAAVRGMLESCDELFDYILIDAPAGITGGFRLAAAMADRGIVVATPDRVSVKGAQSAGDALCDAGLRDVRMVINRLGKKAVEKRMLLNIDDTIDGVGVQLLGIVPENEQLLYSPMQGQRLSSRNDARRAFLRIARRICEENVPLKID